MRRTTFAWLAAVLWLLGLAAAQAQEGLSPTTAALSPETIQIEGQGAEVPLDGRSRYWVDTGAARTIDQIEAAGDTLPWRLREPGQQYRIDGKALWLQFQVAARGPGHWYVQVASSGLDRAQLFYRNGAGHWVVQEAGDSKPVSQWALPGRVPTFELSSPATGEPVRYWLRIEHERVDFAAPVTLYGQGALMALREGEQLLMGAYFGLAALIILVAAANAFAYRDRNFAVYAVYVLTLSVGQVAYLGVGAQHLWDHWLKWNELATFVLPSLSAAAALWFVQGVTEPARFSRGLNLAVWGVIAAVLSAVALDTFLASRASFALVMGLMVVSMVMVAVLIGMVWTQGDDREVRLIALGFLPVLVMAAFPVARSFNLIPNSALTRYGVSIGAAMEMPILFYALSRRGQRRREGHQRAAALPRTDALTGLADTRSLLQRMDTALARSRGQKHGCAAMAVRIANFAAIRSEYGASTGERALVVAASHLRRAIADIDLAARVGEQEFALLLEGPTTAEVAMDRAQKMVASGLRHSDALPPNVVLKFNIAVAMMPERDLDAQASLRWLQDSVNAMRPDTRKLIRPLNF